MSQRSNYNAGCASYFGGGYGSASGCYESLMQISLGQTGPYPGNIGYSTNSKDPTLMKSRVFVGNINTSAWTREQIISVFSPFGEIIGVTVFKGYAFIQYTRPEAADLSIQSLNNKMFHGTVLDVKHAVKDDVECVDSSASLDSNASTGGKRKGVEMGDGEGNAKKVRHEPTELSAIAKQHERNKLFAATDNTTDAELVRHGVEDTLVCGKCQFVTHSFEQFRDHIKADCYARDISVTPYTCAMCEKVLSSADEAIVHARLEHSVVILLENTMDFKMQ